MNKVFKSFVYHNNQDKWSKFEGLDVECAAVMSGGSALENINLFVTSNNKITMYPDDENGIVTNRQTFLKKILEFMYSEFCSFSIDYDKREGVVGCEIVVKNPNFSFSGIKKDFTSIQKFKKHNLPLGFYGNKIEIKIKNADIIRTLLLKYNPRKTRS